MGKDHELPPRNLTSQLISRVMSNPNSSARLATTRSSTITRRWRCRCRFRQFPVIFGCLFIFISVITPLVFLAATQSGRLFFKTNFDHRRRSSSSYIVVQPDTTFDQIERMFPKEVIGAIMANIDDSEALSLSKARRKDLSVSWVFNDDSEITAGSLQGNDSVIIRKGQSRSDKDMETRKLNDHVSKETSETVLHTNNLTLSPAQNARLNMRIQRKVKRLKQLTRKNTDWSAERIEKIVLERAKNIGSSNVLNKYSIWRKENDENSDSFVRLMRDQLIMAKVYASIAQSQNQRQLFHDLRIRIRESQSTLGEASIDSELPHSASEKIKLMGQILSTAREELYDCPSIAKKLRAMLQLSEGQARVLKKQTTFLNQLAAKTLPKDIHCLSMRLTIDYYKLSEEERQFPSQEKLEDTSLFHYALFSDNVLAASVVVNSTIHNAKEPKKHVFHLVTDKLNYPAIKMWFLANPPGNAVIDVQNIDDFTWLNSSYCPVLRQLESAAMKEYYFKADHPTTIAAESSNLKYRNPKYLSMLNHLRFYLPEVYPKLDKILFLDDDIVVQKDLTPLWSVNLQGKVNGAVETCGRSFHRFDKYLNFSNPHIKSNFNPHSCGWAYGMNMFDLEQWKKKDITGIYHKWQNMNEDRTLWKLGTLPPGLITFYGLMHPLEKSWHVLGLGYNPSIDKGEIEGAAVIHYNGNMKPWLEIGMTKYRHYWTSYVNYGSSYLQQYCNVK